MPIFVNKRYPKVKYNYAVQTVYSGGKEISTNKTMEFKNSQFHTDDPEQMEALRNSSDYKHGVLTELKETPLTRSKPEKYTTSKSKGAVKDDGSGADTNVTEKIEVRKIPNAKPSPSAQHSPNHDGSPTSRREPTKSVVEKPAPAPVEEDDDDPFA